MATVVQQPYSSTHQTAKNQSKLLTFLPLGFLGAFLAVSFTPRVMRNDNLFMSFWIVAAACTLWFAYLVVRSWKASEAFSITPKLVRVHWVQGLVHSSLYLYWGYYWRNVYDYAWLLVAQILFSYVFIALMSWSRRKTWLLTLGPLPIVFSTNLFLWFRDDWYLLQFALLSVGYLGKEFLTWMKDGERRHIFNPSGFSLSVFSLGLLITGTTSITWGPHIASTLDLPPLIFPYIFLLGLIVQSLFSVTLTTLGAAIAIVVVNMAYTGVTQNYWFFDANIPIAVFLGLHLLVTDPSTSPKTELGRFIFGVGYGLAVCLTLGILHDTGQPGFYDKLLAVPILNLLVQRIDRFVRSPWLEKMKAATFGLGLSSTKRNWVYMSVWILLFSGMYFSGFTVRSEEHHGSNLAWIESACDQNKRGACRRLVQYLDASCQNNNALDCNKAGVLFAEGKKANQSDVFSARYFEKGCRLGSVDACHNGGIQTFMFGNPEYNAAIMAKTMDKLCTSGDGQSCFLIAMGLKTGKITNASPLFFNDMLRKSCDLGYQPSCQALEQSTYSN